MGKTSKELYAEAEALEQQAKEASKQADEARHRELLAQPLLDRLTFAAYARCECGAGMAYDPAGTTGAGSPFKGPHSWECSDILRFATFDAEKQAKVRAAAHTEPLAFACYEIKSERQPSAYGATTRPEKA